MAHILVADDALIQRISISKILKDDGHKPILASDGAEALEIASTQKVDCIITDLVMPVMGGLELLEALVKQESQVPVIIITADIQESTLNQCLEKGAKALINKPVKADKLRDVLADILEYKGENA